MVREFNVNYTSLARTPNSPYFQGWNAHHRKKEKLQRSCHTSVNIMLTSASLWLFNLKHVVLWELPLSPFFALYLFHYTIIFRDLKVTVMASEKKYSLLPTTTNPLKGPRGESQHTNYYSFQCVSLEGRVKCYFIYFSCTMSVISQ